MLTHSTNASQTPDSLAKALSMWTMTKNPDPALWALKDRDGLSVATYEDGTRAPQATEEVPDLETAMAAADVEMDDEESSGDESEEMDDEELGDLILKAFNDMNKT